MGILIDGLGGMGKSTIAWRLCNRLSTNFQEVILLEGDGTLRRLTEDRLIAQLEEHLIGSDIEEQENLDQVKEYLKNSEQELETRLKFVFKKLDELGKKPLLLVLDEFEWSLEYRNEGFILREEVAEIFSALVNSILNTNHRIIITCRHNFNHPLLKHFANDFGSLNKLSKGDLQKKLNRLENFNAPELDEELEERALKLADGNPRLLEYLNDEVLRWRNADEETAFLCSDGAARLRRLVRAI